MELTPRTTSAASVNPTAGGWHLQIPDGKRGVYRLAQLDDYASLPRGRFPLRISATLSLRCRVSERYIPGTWGFGFWDDPFAFSFGLQGVPQRLPVLPNCCWFFHASEENYLSFAPTRNGFSGNGFLAQTFRSPHIPSLWLAAGILGMPLLFLKLFSRWIRAAAGKIISEDSLALDIDETQWHTYSLKWRESGVVFSVDNAVVFETPVSPQGPLATVIWIDNQYAAWTPDGRIGFGTLQNKAPAWMEIEKVEIQS